MSVVKQGDTIMVHYTGSFEDGEVFDSSHNHGEPLQFTVGEGQVIPGFENGVIGMSVGQKRDIHIPCEEGYGTHSPENLIPVPIDQFPPDIPLLPGTPLDLQTPEGYVVQVKIHEVQTDTVLLDTNHPLAGKNLNFALELVEIL